MTEVINSFLDQLGSSLASTVSQLMSCEVTHSLEGEQQTPGVELWCTAQISSETACQVAIGITRAEGLLLARAMLSEQPAAGAEFTAEDQGLLAEFWKQGFGRATTDLKSLLKDTVLEYASAEEPQWKAGGWSKLALSSEKANVTLAIAVSGELAQRLIGDGQEVAAPAAASGAAANNLDLLLDVPLAVTLRFGQRLMPLRDILQLTSGSVVELDRQAEDAVDLMLDERLIARGQVVVVDGCYGLRVTEVVRGEMLP